MSREYGTWVENWQRLGSVEESSSSTPSRLAMIFKRQGYYLIRA
jgi:hypothetical protein